ncbi:thioredoxin-like protein [Crucibulum laeve]|uniref:Thioredoxin-like protein n=1 Tax=Crucibulum laeve TaxID=68775 RepID=A0A5C3LPG8_9AGAR|nr:thioredoxin-like protein [Crucibulum laeve]
MRSLTTLGGLLLGASFALARTLSESLSQELVRANFNTTTATGLWFVQYTSPYCSHCKVFAPTWEKLVEGSDTKMQTVNFARVNCAVYGDICEQNGIKGYPTMLLHKDGKIVKEFVGSREVERLKSFIKQHMNDNPTTPFIPSPMTPAIYVSPSLRPPPAMSTLAGPVDARPVVNTDSDVKVLTASNYQSVLAKGPAFVKFYTQWCGSCKKIAPIWVRLAKQMEHKMIIAEVDCDEYSDICKAEGIEGYPTLIQFSGGRKEAYNGYRTLEHLKAFAETNLPVISTPYYGKPPPLRPIFEDVSDIVVGTNGNFETMLAQENPIFVMFYAPWCGEACRSLAPIWNLLAMEFQSRIVTAMVNCEEHGDVCKKERIQGFYPTLIYYAKGGAAVYEGEPTREALRAFIEKPQVVSPRPVVPILTIDSDALRPVPSAAGPLQVPMVESETPHPTVNVDGEVLPLTDTTFQSMLAQGPAFVRFYLPQCGDVKALDKIWTQLALDTQYRTTIAEVNCEEHANLCKAEGAEVYPALTYYSQGEQIQYLGPHDIDSLKTMVDIEVFRSRGSVPSLKAELLFDSTSRVQVITSSNFQSTLAQRPAFIVFYSSRCGNCKTVVSPWSQVAQWTQLTQYMQNKVTIAAVNCDKEADLCKAQGIEEYPTIMYYKKGSSSGSQYTSGVSSPALKLFIVFATIPGISTLEKDDDLAAQLAKEDIDVVYVLLQREPDHRISSYIHKMSTYILPRRKMYSSSSLGLWERYCIPSDISWAIVELRNDDVYSAFSVFQDPSPNDRRSKSLRDWLLLDGRRGPNHMQKPTCPLK